MSKRLIYVVLLAVAVSASVYAALRSGSSAAGDAGSEVLAVVNGRKITRKEVDGRAGSRLSGLEGQIYQLRKAALNNIIGDVLVEEEARKTGTSAEELKKRLTPGRVEVTDEQVEAAYAAQANRFQNVEPAAAKRQLRTALETRARMGNYEKFVAELKNRGGFEILLQPPPPVRVDVRGDGPSLGAPDARVVLVEFSDFQCPACKGTDGLVKQLMAEYGDRVRLVYRHLPLPMHKDAFGAAQAAFCAGEQGQFWQMHELLFAKPDGLAPDALKGYAARLGLDAGGFARCVESDASRDAVLRDMEEARAAGIQATPTFVLNGKLISNPRSPAEFKELIDHELQGR
jgi:protein-disulfide isomerase